MVIELAILHWMDDDNNEVAGEFTWWHLEVVEDEHGNLRVYRNEMDGVSPPRTSVVAERR